MRLALQQHCLNLLEKGAWFGSLPEDLKTRIIDSSVLKLAKADQTFFTEDARPIGLFAVLEGQVAITRLIGDDAEFFFHLGGPGFWFGDTGLLNQENTVVTATARTQVKALLLTIERFLQIVDAQPRYYPFFVKLTMGRHATLFRTLAQGRVLPPIEFLKTRLADISDMIRSEGNQSDIVELAISQSDLANMIGVTRQTINMLVRKLEAEGLIEVAFRKIRILDAQRLRGSHRKTGL